MFNTHVPYVWAGWGGCLRALWVQSTRTQGTLVYKTYTGGTQPCLISARRLQSRARRLERRLQPLQMHRNTQPGIWSGRTSRLHATCKIYAAFQAAKLPLQTPRKEIWSARAGSWSRFKCYGKYADREERPFTRTPAAPNAAHRNAKQQRTL